MSQLQTSIEETRKSYWDRKSQEARGKSVLVVEGDDDKAVLEAVFRRRSPAFPLQVLVVVAGSRNHVLKAAAQFSGHAVHLLVDRDTWSDQDVITQQQRQGPAPLHVTSGWCLENVFLDPRFLHTYAPEIAARLEAEREAWVRAGALWWCVQRTREALHLWHEALGTNYGRPHAEIDDSSATSLSASLSRLMLAHNAIFALNIDTLATDIQQRIAHILTLPKADQWLHVHGKHIFNQIVVPLLTASRGQRESWRDELAGAIGRPAPLDLIIAQLLP